MNAIAFVSKERVHWASKKLVLVMFFMVCFQVVATPEEGQVVARFGVFLMLPVGILGLATRSLETLTWGFAAMALNLLFVQF